MATNTQKINVKGVLKYALLPGIIPRAKALGGSGFGYLAFLFACVYRSVRILPPTHPYVNPANIGKFGIISVIRAAANNVEISRRNIDQVIVFFALVAAVILLFMQFALLIVTFFSGQAFAQPVPGPTFTSIFLTANPQTDIAFLILDHVFGIPGADGTGSFFGSNALGGGPTPFHQGLHALFNFYNLAILLVGVLIFLYYVIVVVIETAQTGVPFGRRFSKLYAPFRLIIAVGLLVPLNYGFNAAQYVTLYAAKLGSSFATNGWILYNRTLQNPTGAQNASLVARPRNAALDELHYFSSVYHACGEIYNLWKKKIPGRPDSPGICIRAYVVIDGNTHLFANSNAESCGASGLGGPLGYNEAKDLIGKGDLEVILGEYDPNEHKSFAGGVNPYCGKITISLNNDNPPYYNGEGGVRRVEQYYYTFMQGILSLGTQVSNLNSFVAFGQRTARALIKVNAVRDTCWKSDVLDDNATCATENWKPPAGVFLQQITSSNSALTQAMNIYYTNFRNNLDLKLTAEMENRGWGGAGIWYNNIADMNGSLTSAIYALPSVKKYPAVMELVKNARLEQNKSGGLCETFTPNLGDAKPVKYKSPGDESVAIILNEAYKYFACEKPTQAVGAPIPATPAAAGAGCPALPPQTITTGSVTKGVTSNTFIDVVSIIFGINGLFDLRTASCWDNATGRVTIHPLAQLSALGRALVENAIRSMAIAIGAAFGGGIVGILSPALGAGLEAASGMFVGIATIGLTTGFLLYYILPFLPFIYFFFAVGSWVKSIFEAMVGVPLWALAHLHIDGDGLSGGAAKGGYFLLLEIFLRPIVTLFGLIGGIAIFTAMAGMLNNLFDLVILNTSGAFPGGSTATMGAGELNSFRRGVIDQFFFTIMYAILLYMMATASFKMIDTVPSSFMRWIGSGVSTFNDNKEDPTANLGQYVALGGSQISGQILGGIQQGARGAGGLVGSLASEMGGGNTGKTPP